MKMLLISAMILSALISCDKKEEDIDIDPDVAKYSIKFQLKDSEGNTKKINLTQENPRTISGNGIKDSDNVSTGFGLSGSFVSPSEKQLTQQLFFYLAIEIPEAEFNFDSGRYEFKNPSNFENYISSRNLFEDGTQSISTYFHEDVKTFCSAQLDSTFDNTFYITKTSHYVDNNGNDAMDIEGMFTTRYNSVCNNGDVELEDGTFRIKLLIDEIP